jgi:hypothetical protein
VLSEQSGAGKRLLEEVREVLRRNHYSIHTERIYCEWVRRFVRFHGMTRGADLASYIQAVMPNKPDTVVLCQWPPELTH